MIIAGFSPNSFVDYPKNIAAVIFLAGCNLDCWYCHNRDLIEGRFEQVSLEEILKRIEEKKGFLDGVVITGGEALLSSLDDLISLAKKIKEMGLLVKLDTNGTRPEKLKALLPYLDYVAMDIKAPLDKYSIVTPIQEEDIENIKKSIDILMNSDIDYEFRTTFDPHLTIDDIETIAKTIKGAKAYNIQQINIPAHIDMKRYSTAYIMECVERANKYVTTTARSI
jgi:pyruvate formate lyase activating enzyme